MVASDALKQADATDLAAQLAGVLSTHFVVWPRWRGGWPGQADAALVDAAFSTRSNYESTVLPLVHRWMAARDSRPDLGVNLSALTTAGREFLSAAVANGQYVPGRTKKLKVDAVLEVAHELRSEGLDSAEQIVTAAYRHRGHVRGILERVTGVGRAQFAYFLMLLGVEGVKAHTLVTDWVCSALGVPSMPQRDIEEVVAGAAALLRRCSIEVDHGIWRAESTARWARRSGSRSARRR